MNFPYGQKEIDYLCSRDKHLARAIELRGHIEREVRPDLFAALVRTIIGQQISTKAQATIWQRLEALLGVITPYAVAELSLEKLQAIGISFRKAGYIKGSAECVVDGRIHLEALRDLSDAEVCNVLCTLPGIGVWTAEMLMLFSLMRPNIISFKDLGIIRGMCRLYHHRRITADLFERYRRRYAPYASVASLYIWDIAGGQND